jgi:hypothetical protein
MKKILGEKYTLHQIVIMRFAEKKTLQEIGDIIGTSKEAVRLFLNKFNIGRPETLTQKILAAYPNTVEEISKLTNAKCETIYQVLREKHLEIKHDPKHPYMDKEWLNNEYTIKRKKMVTIAKECNTNYNTIKRWLVKFNISIRVGHQKLSKPRNKKFYYPLHDYNWMKNKINTGFTVKGIAEEVGGCTYLTALKAVNAAIKLMKEEKLNGGLHMENPSADYKEHLECGVGS